MSRELLSTEELKQKMARTEIPLLILAAASVILYLTWLNQMWKDTEWLYLLLEGIIDFIFVLDLLFKVWLRRRAYVNTPWFLIDFISTLPAILLFYPTNIIDPSFRAVRSFRFLRLIRSVRVLNLLVNLRRKEDRQADNKEEKIYIRSMYGSIILFSITFLTLLDGIYQGIDPSNPDYEQLMLQAQKHEYYLIIGALIGLSAIIWVVKNQIPAVSKQHVHNLLNIALPHQVAKQILEHPEDYNKTVRMPATVIFCDIQGFTSAVESIGDDLDTFKEHLEDAMNIIVEVYTKYDLIVDKFIGDCVMAFRGGDMVQGSPEEHAYRVVRASLESLIAIQELDDPFFKNVRIGGASGKNLLIGTFGTSRRLSYTILGDRVNLASRLESVCKKLCSNNLFCKRTYDLLNDKADIAWRSLGMLDIRGKKEKIEIFEAFDVDSGENLDWIPIFNTAIQKKEQGDITGAKKLFQQVNDIRVNGDPASQQILKEIEGTK